VTALLPVPQGLLIGTYDQGVHLLRAGRVEPLLALAAQWVPPGGLAREGQGVWVGGIGMAPVHFEEGRASRLPVPTEDVYHVLRLGSERILLGSEGLIRAR
jgi:hypothetical protein